MTVGENVCFPLHEHGFRGPKRQRQRCARVLRIVGLDGLEPKMPSTLSGGQRKRVALARALIMEPEVVLYDEPTTGLDPIRGDLIDELIRLLTRDLGITGIVVTHDMTSARKISDRMLILHDGRFIADGTYDELAAWDDERVQRFLQGRAEGHELARIKAGLRDTARGAARGERQA
jgi:phospholipid/cholesterol/gamma-HCH transport system ATP-binding protein